MYLVGVIIVIVMLAAVILFLSAFLFVRKVIKVSLHPGRNKLRNYFSDRFLKIIMDGREPDYNSIRRSFSAMLKRSRFSGKYSRRMKTVAARGVLISIAQQITGEELERTRNIFKSLGFVRGAVNDLRDSRWWERARAIRELQIMKCNSALDALFPLLSDPDEDIRLLAFEASLDISGPEAIPLMIGAFPKISLWSAINLSHNMLAKKTFAGDLLMPLLNISEKSVRGFAIQMLGMFEWIPAVGELIRIAGGSDLEDSVYALLSLTAIGDSRTYQAAIKAAGSSYWQIRVCAALLLGRLGDESAVPTLIKMLHDPNHIVQRHAASALSKLGTEGKQALDFAAADKTFDVWEVALEILHEQKLGITPPELVYQW